MYGAYYLNHLFLPLTQLTGSLNGHILGGRNSPMSFLPRLTLLIQTYDYVSSLNEEVMR